MTLVLIAALSRRKVSRIFAICGLVLMLGLFIPHAMQMNYAGRYYFQITFPALLLFLALEDIVSISRLTCVTCLLFTICIAPQELRYTLTYFPYARTSHIDLGLRLAPFARDHTLLTGDAGMIPYYSDWISYDFFGLCTGKIARHGLTPTVLHQLHPDLILVYGQHPGAEVLSEPRTSGLVHDESAVLDYIAQAGDYRYVGASKWRDYYLLEFLRTGTPQYAEIARALQRNDRTSSEMKFSVSDLLMQKYVPWRR